MKKYEIALFFAWLFSVFGVCLSVVLGEILGNAPCSLCWYQRICLFPLAIILAVATYRSDRTVVFYAMPLALIGAIIAALHLIQSKIPFLQTAGLCNGTVHCSEEIFSLFGLNGFPLLSLVGFFLIFGLLWMARPSR